MAKKKAKVKIKGKPAPKTRARSSLRSTRVSTPEKPKRKRHVPQPLPGMEEVRNVQLDRICVAIAETRGEMNRLRQEETGYEQAAHAEMRRAGLTSYRHAGIELYRVPGEEKLRVRTSKEATSAETHEEPDGVRLVVESEFDQEDEDDGHRDEDDA